MKLLFSNVGIIILYFSIVIYTSAVKIQKRYISLISKFIFQDYRIFYSRIKYIIKRVRHISLPAMKCSNRSLKFFGRQLWNEFHTSMITVAFIFITSFEVGSW